MDYYSRKNKRERQFMLFINTLIIVCISLHILLYVFYSHRYGIFFNIVSYVSYGLGLIGTISLYLNYVPETFSKKWQKFLINFAFLLFIIASLFGINRLKVYYDSYQLSNYGKKANATVIGYDTVSYKGSKTHYAIIRYTFDTEVYDQQILNDDGFYSINDKLELLVSEKDPQLFKVLNTYRNH